MGSLETICCCAGIIFDNITLFNISNAVFNIFGEFHAPKCVTTVCTKERFHQASEVCDL